MRSGSLVHALTVSVADSSVADGELLARFAGTGDAAAFELLVRRHADLVWRVCRSELPADRHSAEDAFQSTFLVLARKAGAVREPSAAGFLFRVARNAAQRARKRVGRVAEAVAEVPMEASGDPVEADECSAAVVAEVERLPDKFRLPVLLCFFDNCTHAEAADRLGWAVGTVASRLARAKDRLRDRLTRRGLAMPAVLAGAAASTATLRAAVAVATTPSAVPAGVSELTREVLNAMWNAKAKLIGGGVLAALLVGGLGLTGLTAGPNPDEPKPKAKLPEKEKPEEAELKKMQGLWRVTRLVGDPGEAPPEVIAPMRWEIVGNTVFGQDTPEQKRMAHMQLALDPTKTPKQVTVTALAGPKDEIGKKMDGIYELKDNKLRMCFVEAGKPRPTEFKVAKGDEKSGLIELERIPETIKSLKDLAGEWRVLSMDNDGKPVAGADKTVFDFHRDVAWVVMGDKITRVIVELDGEKGHIDFTQIRTPEASQVELGRFTWKDDKLTLVFGEAGTPRPAEANSGKNTTVVVLERAAKK